MKNGMKRFEDDGRCRRQCGQHEEKWDLRFTDSGGNWKIQSCHLINQYGIIYDRISSTKFIYHICPVSGFKNGLASFKWCLLPQNGRNIRATLGINGEIGPQNQVSGWRIAHEMVHYIFNKVHFSHLSNSNRMSRMAWKRKDGGRHLVSAR